MINLLIEENSKKNRAFVWKRREEETEKTWMSILEKDEVPQEELVCCGA